MRLLPFVAICGALVGCANNNPKEQVWFVTIQAPTEPIEVLQQVTHNFADGRVPDVLDATEWDVTDGYVTSDAIVTVQIVELDGDENHDGLLIMEGLVYPGVEGDDGTWTFTWENFDNIETRQDHESGYLFETIFQGSGSTTFTWSVDKKTNVASGTIDAGFIWKESDTFDVSEVGLYPQIPSWNYLIDDAGYPVQNAPSASDCTSAPCTVQYSESQILALTFTAVETEYRDEDVFGAVDDAGQPYGN